jgi:hypothetical protein
MKEKTNAVDEFKKEALDARAHKITIAKQKADAEASLVNKKQERSAIKAVGQNPEQLIKEGESQVKDLDRALQLADQQIRAIFDEEEKQLMAEDSRVWKGNYEEVIQPLVHAFASSLGSLETTLSEASEKASDVKSAKSSQFATAREHDLRVDSFYQLRKEFGLGAGTSKLANAEKRLKDEISKVLEKAAKDISGLVETFRKTAATAAH